MNKTVRVIMQQIGVALLTTLATAPLSMLIAEQSEKMLNDGVPFSTSFRERLTMARMEDLGYDINEVDLTQF